MSWETLVVGELKLKEGISKEEESKILRDFEEVLECKLGEAARDGECYSFQDINWSSHVAGEKIAKVVEKYRNKIEYFDCSIYYLDIPHENMFFDKGDWVEKWVL